MSQERDSWKVTETEKDTQGTHTYTQSVQVNRWGTESTALDLTHEIFLLRAALQKLAPIKNLERLANCKLRSNPVITLPRLSHEKFDDVRPFTNLS